MITLYTFGPAFGLPDPSPFVTKAEVLLKLAGLSYETNAKGFGKAPKGKLPFIDDAGEIVPDSTFIRMHIERKYGFDYDAGLDAAQRGTAWAVEKMLEEHAYFLTVHERWMNDENFFKGPVKFFDRAPALIRPLIIKMVRRQVRKSLHGQGLGRHGDAERALLAARDYDALAAILGDKPWLMGEKPCGADATVFAFVAGALCTQFNSPTREAAARHANLVAYRDRGMARFYPDFKAG
jgi:glutathione S-transferase